MYLTSLTFRSLSLSLPCVRLFLVTTKAVCVCAWSREEMAIKLQCHHHHHRFGIIIRTIKKRKQTPPLLCTFRIRDVCDIQCRERETLESIIMPYALRYTLWFIFVFVSFFFVSRSFVQFELSVVQLCSASTLYSSLFSNINPTLKSKTIRMTTKTATMIIANNTFRVSTHTRSISHIFTLTLAIPIPIPIPIALTLTHAYLYVPKPASQPATIYRTVTATAYTLSPANEWIRSHCLNVFTVLTCLSHSLLGHSFSAEMWQPRPLAQYERTALRSVSFRYDSTSFYCSFGKHNRITPPLEGSIRSPESFKLFF